MALCRTLNKIFNNLHHTAEVNSGRIKVATSYKESKQCRNEQKLKTPTFYVICIKLYVHTYRNCINVFRS